MARSSDPCEINVSVVVDRPIQTCWDLYIDNTIVADWAPAIEQVAPSANTLAKGVSRKNQVIVNGQAAYTVELCTEFEPLKRIEMSVTEESIGFAHMLTSYGLNTTFDVTNDQTLIVVQTQYTPKKIFASLMTSRATQQQLHDLMTDYLNGFKHYAEKRSTLTSIDS